MGSSPSSSSWQEPFPIPAVVVVAGTTQKAAAVSRRKRSYEAALKRSAPWRQKERNTYDRSCRCDLSGADAFLLSVAARSRTPPPQPHEDLAGCYRFGNVPKMHKHVGKWSTLIMPNKTSTKNAARRWFPVFSRMHTMYLRTCIYVCIPQGQVRSHSSEIYDAPQKSFTSSLMMPLLNNVVRQPLLSRCGQEHPLMHPYWPRSSPVRVMIQHALHNQQHEDRLRFSFTKLDERR